MKKDTALIHFVANFRVTARTTNYQHEKKKSFFICQVWNHAHWFTEQSDSLLHVINSSMFMEMFWDIINISLKKQNDLHLKLSSVVLAHVFNSLSQFFRDNTRFLLDTLLKLK